MIIDEFINVKINSTNFKWYFEKGYGPFHKNDIIRIKINDLSVGSAVKIRVKCDICEKEMNMRYQYYLQRLKNKGYYVCFGCKEIKSKITNVERYGCEYGLQSKEIQNKSKDTCMKKYGVDNISKVDYIKESRKDNFKNINFKNKSKDTWMEKYGVDNPSKSDIIKDKKIITTMKNWGVENPMQSYNLFEKSQISGKRINYHDETKLKYRGTYEKDFLDYCYSNNILIEKGPTIIYYHKNKKKYYHSDFYIPSKNLICEIKSDYYLNKYYDINQSKKEYAIKEGYNFNFVVNKNYSEL
jgi:hypothetical protein